MLFLLLTLHIKVNTDSAFEWTLTHREIPDTVIHFAIITKNVSGQWSITVYVLSVNSVLGEIIIYGSAC